MSRPNGPPELGEERERKVTRAGAGGGTKFSLEDEDAQAGVESGKPCTTNPPPRLPPLSGAFNAEIVSLERPPAFEPPVSCRIVAGAPLLSNCRSLASRALRDDAACFNADPII